MASLAVVLPAYANEPELYDRKLEKAMMEIVARKVGEIRGPLGEEKPVLEAPRSLIVTSGQTVRIQQRQTEWPRDEGVQTSFESAVEEPPPPDPTAVIVKLSASIEAVGVGAQDVSLGRKPAPPPAAPKAAEPQAPAPARIRVIPLDSGPAPLN